MDKTAKQSNLKAVITLYFLSPLIAELLFGSTPVSRAYLLIIESLFYGSSALLIREFARRYNLGWYSIILLGIASGILEECFVLQSVFNPSFLNLDMTFGRKWGVNWVWAVSIIGYHAIWSTTIPIVFAELLYPTKAGIKWLRKPGLILFSVMLALSCFILFTIFYKMSGYIASAPHFITALVTIAGLVLLSLRIPSVSKLQKKIKPLNSFVSGLIGFIASVLWLGQITLVFSKDIHVSAMLILIGGFLLALLTFFITDTYIAGSAIEIKRFSLASGAILASMLFGLVVTAGSGNKIDMYSQIIFIIIVVLLLMRLRLRTSFLIIHKNNKRL